MVEWIWFPLPKSIQTGCVLTTKQQPELHRQLCLELNNLLSWHFWLPCIIVVAEFLTCCCCLFKTEAKLRPVFFCDHQHSPVLGELWSLYYRRSSQEYLCFCLCISIHYTEVYWRRFLFKLFILFSFQENGPYYSSYPPSPDLWSAVLQCCWFPMDPMTWCLPKPVHLPTEFRERVFLPQLWYFFTDEIFSSTQAIRTLYATVNCTTISNIFIQWKSWFFWDQYFIFFFFEAVTFIPEQTFSFQGDPSKTFDCVYNYYSFPHPFVFVPVFDWFVQILCSTSLTYCSLYDFYAFISGHFPYWLVMITLVLMQQKYLKLGIPCLQAEQNTAAKQRLLQHLVP